MTIAPPPDVVLLRRRWPRRVTGVVPVLAAALVATTGLVVRGVGEMPALQAAGPVMLGVAFVLGVPHGALDADFLPPSGVTSRAVRTVWALSYLLFASIAFVAWLRWPSVTIAGLLVVAGVHFASAELAFGRSTAVAASVHRAGTRAVSVGVLAVAGPFAFWPERTSQLLRALDARSGAATVSAVAAVAVTLAALLALMVTIGDIRAGAHIATIEPLVVLLLVWSCPPLVAFAVYFGLWHSLRQSARVLALHPALTSAALLGARRRAVVHVASKAGIATVGAAGALVALAASDLGISAAVLVALLALAVPHTATDILRDRAASATSETEALA